MPGGALPVGRAVVVVGGVVVVVVGGLDHERRRLVVGSASTCIVVIGGTVGVSLVVCAVGIASFVIAVVVGFTGGGALGAA
jgi:hypothetical protein